jgi:hypothetical protein
MEKIKAFVFKERSLRSLIWLWGILGTLILSLIVDLLSNSFLSGPWGYGNSFWLIAIYYFFTLFLSYRTYTSKPIFKSFVQFFGQMAVNIEFNL